MSQLRKADLFRDIVIETIRERDGDQCPICHFPMIFDGSQPIHLDHILPLARGGSNSLSNFQLAHGACNLQKGPGRAQRQLRFKMSRRGQRPLEVIPEPTESEIAMLRKLLVNPDEELPRMLDGLRRRNARVEKQIKAKTPA